MFGSLFPVGFPHPPRFAFRKRNLSSEKQTEKHLACTGHLLLTRAAERARCRMLFFSFVRQKGHQLRSHRRVSTPHPGVPHERFACRLVHCPPVGTGSNLKVQSFRDNRTHLDPWVGMFELQASSWVVGSAIIQASVMTPLDTQAVGCELNHLTFSELKQDLKREGARMSRELRRRPVPHRLLLSFGSGETVLLPV